MEVMAKVGIHANPHPSPSLRTLLRLHTQNPLSLSRCRSLSVYDHRCFLLLSPWPLHIRRSRQWDSDAETYNSKNFNFGDDVEREDFDDGVQISGICSNLSVLSLVPLRVVDGYLKIKPLPVQVLGSYGWLLPAIIISLLLTNGPKAFLMALALPLGQSTFAFAIQRFQNRGKIKPKPKTKTKKGRSRAYSSRKAKMEEEAEWIGSRQPGKKKKGYQSWVSKTDVSDSSNDKSAANFGGWDELDVGMDSNVGSSGRAGKKSSGFREGRAENGKNKKWSESDGPLLLRCIPSLPIIQLGSCLNMEIQADTYLESKVDKYSLKATQLSPQRCAGANAEVISCQFSPSWHSFLHLDTFLVNDYFGSSLTKWCWWHNGLPLYARQMTSFNLPKPVLNTYVSTLALFTGYILGLIHVIDRVG
ncbi:UNVERIFIED_CONTAM: hypothetical protein Slati_2646000 [Sesamum latifolium]|uniref:Uncharacterized protein n=1 Tax=Sesamum latifolium TaxID=2727402 RepID=A0AAW2VUX3_9LAMI